MLKQDQRHAGLPLAWLAGGVARNRKRSSSLRNTLPGAWSRTGQCVLTTPIMAHFVFILPPRWVWSRAFTLLPHVPHPYRQGFLCPVSLQSDAKNCSRNTPHEVDNDLLLCFPLRVLFHKERCPRSPLLRYARSLALHPANAILPPLSTTSRHSRLQPTPGLAHRHAYVTILHKFATLHLASTSRKHGCISSHQPAAGKSQRLHDCQRHASQRWNHQ